MQSVHSLRTGSGLGRIGVGAGFCLSLLSMKENLLFIALLVLKLLKRDRRRKTNGEECFSPLNAHYFIEFLSFLIIYLKNEEKIRNIVSSFIYCFYLLYKRYA